MIVSDMNGQRWNITSDGRLTLYTLYMVTRLVPSSAVHLTPRILTNLINSTIDTFLGI